MSVARDYQLCASGLGSLENAVVIRVLRDSCHGVRRNHHLERVEKQRDNTKDLLLIQGELRTRENVLDLPENIR